MSSADMIEKTIIKLKDILYVKTFFITNFTKIEGDYISLEEVDSLDSAWEVCDKDTTWGKNSMSAWFRFEFQIPEEFKKRTIALRIKSDDANSQFLVYINKELKFHLAENSEQNIKGSSESKINFKVDVSARAKDVENEKKIKFYLLVIDEYVKELLFYLKQSLYVVKRFNIDDSVSIEIMGILNDAINILDLTELYSDNFDKSILKALIFLKDNLGGLDKNQNVGNIDCTIFMPKDLNPMFILNNLNLCNSMEINYKLTLNNLNDILYIKNNYSDIYSKILENVDNKNFELVIGIDSYDASSDYGEALIRNILYKKEFLLTEFNKDVNVVLFYKDNYLHAFIPQILSKLGISYAFFEEKDIVNIKSGFLWVGMNGDSIKCGIYREVNDNISFKNLLDIYKSEKNDSNNRYVISCFNNTECDKLKLETLCKVSWSIPFIPSINFHTISEECENIHNYINNNVKNHKCFGDLNLHHSKVNSIDSKLELRLLSCETWNAFHYLQDNEHNDDIFNKCWKNIDNKELIKSVTGDIIHDVKEKICSKIHSSDSAIVVFNSISFLRDEIVEFNYEGSFENKVIEDGEGNIVNHQIYADDGIEKIIFLASLIPPMGYKTFFIKDGVAEPCPINVKDGVMESNTLKVVIDTEGNITSIFDKVNNREVVKKDKKCNEIKVYEKDSQNDESIKISEEQNSIEIIEFGNARGVIKVRGVFNDSVVEQIISIYNNSLRIDFKTKIYLNDFYDISARFQFNINSPKFMCPVPFGILQKNFSYFNETVRRNWVSLYEDKYKIQIANDKNCYINTEGDEVEIILATSRSPSLVEVNYSLYLESYSGFENLIKNSLSLNSKVEAEIIEKNILDNPYPSIMSMAWVDSDNVILQTLKKSKDKDEIVIRLYEIENKETECVFSFYRKIYDIFECDMLENKISEITNDNNKFMFTIKPCEIKTFCFKALK